ncbi:MAG: hypothetical protein WC776_04940 [Patescibacteria group bacterium]|jgi:hypothetical protein
MSYSKKQNQEWAMKLLLKYVDLIFFDMTHSDFSGKDQFTDKKLRKIIKCFEEIEEYENKS